MGRRQFDIPSVAAVDLFCGAGGLTHGLCRTGVRVAAGIDLDPACEFPFAANNESSFILRDVAQATAADVLSLYPRDAVRVLVGCAPCQPFSRYSRRGACAGGRRWSLLSCFSRLIAGVRPAVVSMENVPELSRHSVFSEFVAELRALGYHVTHSNVYCPDYGIAQHRVRLVLFASLASPVRLIRPTHCPRQYQTVRDAIGALRPLVRGQVDARDPLHRACKLSDLNYARIQASKPGGTWRDWPSRLVANCHRTDSGKTYPSVYGRMEWGKPAPTITTQFFGLGNGRFGHPEQDRALSLREGALLQSFPRSYRFCPDGADIKFSIVGRLIGNAVPVGLGEVIGRSILEHVADAHGQEIPER